MNAVGPDLQTSGNNWAVVTPDMLAQAAARSKPIDLRRRPRLFETLEQEMAVFAAEHELNLREVQRNYVVNDGASVLNFLTQHRTIPQLVLEGIPHLKQCFGDEASFSLRLVSEDSDLATLFGVVMWRGCVADAKAALARFDEAWWLGHVRQASGHLVFTYELV